MGNQNLKFSLKNQRIKKLYDLVKNMKFIDVKKNILIKDNLISDKKAIDETSSTQSKKG